MKKHFLFTVVLLLVQQFFLCSANLFAQTSDFLWAKQGGGVNFNDGNGIAVDASGNIYVTGKFYGTANFDHITLAGSGGWDMFIAKYDASGNLLWAKKEGGTNNDSGNGIAVDASGNIYVTGDFIGSITFGSTTLTGSGGWDMLALSVSSFRPFTTVPSLAINISEFPLLVRVMLLKVVVLP